MDRENSLTVLWLEWGWNPIPSDPQSEPLIDCATDSGSTLKKVVTKKEKKNLFWSGMQKPGLPELTWDCW
jgi:hypothetical protein